MVWYDGMERQEPWLKQSGGLAFNFIFALMLR